MNDMWALVVYKWIFTHKLFIHTGFLIRKGFCIEGHHFFLLTRFFTFKGVN